MGVWGRLLTPLKILFHADSNELIFVLVALTLTWIVILPDRRTCYDTAYGVLGLPGVMGETRVWFTV